MLGALSYASHHFDVAYMRGAVDHFFAKKGKNNPKNGVCFDRGVEAAKKTNGMTRRGVPYTQPGQRDSSS